MCIFYVISIYLSENGYKNKPFRGKNQEIGEKIKMFFGHSKKTP